MFCILLDRIILHQTNVSCLFSQLVSSVISRIKYNHLFIITKQWAERVKAGCTLSITYVMCYEYVTKLLIFWHLMKQCWFAMCISTVTTRAFNYPAHLIQYAACERFHFNCTQHHINENAFDLNFASLLFPSLALCCEYQECNIRSRCAS